MFRNAYIATALLLAALPALSWGQTGLTVELIDERLSVLRESGVGGQDQRVENYQAARALLVQRDAHDQQAAVFAETAASARWIVADELLPPPAQGSADHLSSPKPSASAMRSGLLR